MTSQHFSAIVEGEFHSDGPLYVCDPWSRPIDQLLRVDCAVLTEGPYDERKRCEDGNTHQSEYTSPQMNAEERR